MQKIKVRSYNLRVVSSLPGANRIIHWSCPLASLSPLFAGVTSDHRGMNDGGLNQWIRVIITLLEIHLSYFMKE